MVNVALISERTTEGTNAPTHKTWLKDCHAPQIRPKQVVEFVKRRFSQVQSQIITFPRRSHYNIFNTEAREAKGLLKDCHGPEKRDSAMNWSNRVYDTALVRNICCPFAFLATFSLPRCRRKLYDTASCRHVGGRAPPTPEASASLPVDK